MSANELKPCPFCGQEAHIEKVRVRVRRGRAKGRRTMKTNLMYTIGCSDPDCILHSTKRACKLLFTASTDGLDTMIRRWNRRLERSKA
jgi:hypothetical protein